MKYYIKVKPLIVCHLLRNRLFGVNNLSNEKTVNISENNASICSRIFLDLVAGYVLLLGKFLN